MLENKDHRTVAQITNAIKENDMLFRDFVIMHNASLTPRRIWFQRSPYLLPANI